MNLNKFSQITLNFGCNMTSKTDIDFLAAAGIPKADHHMYVGKPVYVIGVTNTIGKCGETNEVTRGYTQYTADFNNIKFICSKLVEDTNFCLMDLSFIPKLPIRNDVNSSFILTELESGGFEVFSYYEFNRSGNVLFKEEHCRITCMADIHRLINRINNALLHNFTLEI